MRVGLRKSSPFPSMAAVVYEDDDDKSSDASSDFFSPISLSFFGGRVSQQASSLSKTTTPEPLPPLHDSSWIGARLSPIHSFDREEENEDDEDQRYTQIYHRALHDSLGAAAFVNERSSLLNNSKDPRSNIHPLWENADGSAAKNFGKGGGPRPFRITWGLILCSTSALYLLTMGYYDFQFSRRQEEDSGDYAWAMPWLRPSSSSLERYGAFVPFKVLIRGEYWRLFSSLFISTSILEWTLAAIAWRLIFLAATAEPWHRYAGTYFASCFVGQLWMLSWDHVDGVLCGMVLWGTGGVLCSIGIRYVFVSRLC